MKTIDEVKEEFLNDPASFIKQVEEVNGIKLREVQIIDDTEDFLTLCEKSAGYYFLKVKVVRPFLIFSLVEDSLGYVLKIHNCLTFVMADGSFIRYSPTEEGLLEVTRIEVAQSRMGIGSFLLDFTSKLFSMILERTFTIQVELTGAVGLNETLKIIGQENQISFFEKHGFEIIDNSNEIIRMEKIILYSNTDQEN